MNERPWREKDRGAFVTGLANFSLRVCRDGDKLVSRFLVYGWNPAGTPVLLGSGTTDNLAQAMCAAEDMARRLDTAAKAQLPPVIVADDDEMIGTLVAEILGDEGYAVSVFTSAEGVLRHLERAPRPCVLAADKHLGYGMDGAELAAAVQEVSPDSGFLLMSGDEVSDASPTPDAFLPKPFSVSQLIEAVAVAAQCCNQRRISARRTSTKSCVQPVKVT